MLVRVEWWDPCGTATWASREEAATLVPVRCITVGEIVHRSRSVLVIAATVGDHGQVADFTAIPRGCVRKITRVR